jgi:hypothetical protein
MAEISRLEGRNRKYNCGSSGLGNSTNYFKRKILKEEIESRCRLCKEYEETIDYLKSGSGKE